MRKIGTREIAVASVLGALSVLSEIIPGPPFDIPFPLLPKVSWDITGLPMMISLLLYGPVSAVYTCLVGCSIIFLRGNVYGGIFKVVAELATLLAFSLLKRGIVVNSAAAVASRVVVMTIANYYLLQLFYGMPEAVVISLLVSIGLFNVTQALINIIPAYIIYLRVRGALTGTASVEGMRKELVDGDVHMRAHKKGKLRPAECAIEILRVGDPAGIREGFPLTSLLECCL